MNFSRAVKGSLTRGGVVKEIDSQTETELGRPLTPSEKTSLFARYPPELVLSRIEKVCYYQKIVNKLN